MAGTCFLGWLLIRGKAGFPAPEITNEIDTGPFFVM